MGTDSALGFRQTPDFGDRALDRDDPCGHVDFDPDARASWAIRSIRWYQRGVEGRPSPCRFTPSCSSYALEAVQGHGTVRGLFLAARRLVRCRPFGPSGFDPVPVPCTPDRKLAD